MISSTMLSLILAATLMIDVRPSEERGNFNHGWLQTAHTFSFGEYNDPRHMGYRTLRVINEDVIAPTKGFDTHAHRNMEILTVVLEGQIAHKDSMGHEEIIQAGEVQLMSAGSGIRHSERNPSKDEKTHLLQIWIEPDSEGLKPGYQQRSFPEMPNSLVLIASKEGKEQSLKINQDALVYMANLDPGAAIDYTIRQGRHIWVQVAKGEIDIQDKTLKAGDGCSISEDQLVKLNASQATVLLLFDLG